MKTYSIQSIQHADRRLPVDACVGNRDAVFKRGRTLGGYILSAFVDVGLDHHTSDVLVSGPQLRTNVVEDFRLIVVVLLRVAVCRFYFILFLSSQHGVTERGAGGLQIRTAAVNHD
jgi:hypothetical protein